MLIRHDPLIVRFSVQGTQHIEHGKLMKNLFIGKANPHTLCKITALWHHWSVVTWCCVVGMLCAIVVFCSAVLCCVALFFILWHGVVLRLVLWFVFWCC